MAKDSDSKDLSNERELMTRDVLMAGEIAEFIAERAFEFDDHECRAWVITSFRVWSILAGREPLLRLGPVLPPDAAE